MRFSRRQFVRFVGAAAIVSAVPASALDWPTQPVRVIVPYAAGGSPDIAARLIGQWLSQRLGQQFIIENRTGANGNIGTEAVVRAPADGYTILFATVSMVINTSIYDRLSFNFIRDIAPVAGIMSVPNVMVVGPSVPVKTVPAFIAYAKANPSKINFASSGNGSALHLSGELFKALAGINMIHVPYRGGAPAAVTDMLAGHVQVMFDNMPHAIEYIRAGRLRALAVTTATRSTGLPDIPTLGEFLPGYEMSVWYGIGAPRDTPLDIIEKLNKEINAGLADPDMKLRFVGLGGGTLAGSPADFGKLIVDETEKWAKVVKLAGIKLE